MEEVNTKRRLGYKIIEDSDRPNKLKILYQQTVHLLEEEIPKQLQRRSKFAPYLKSYVEEHLKEARNCKASLDYHWLTYISKDTQPAMNAEQSKTTQTSSAKQRRDERMKKFDIEYKTKMRLDQTRLERRKLELELQLKELETKHQLLKEERELERNIKRIA